MLILPALCQNWVCQRDPFLEGVPITSKGDLTVIPQYVWVLSSSWVSLSSLCQSGPSRVSCVYECSLLFWSMPAPRPLPGTLINLLLTCNILGAIRTPPELLDASSDPCGFMWGDRMQTHYNPLYLPETCPVTQFQMELSWVHPSWVFCVETGWNETLVDHVVTCRQTQGHNHLNPVMWHACVCV